MAEPRPELDPEERREELTRAPKSSPEDAAPRISLSEGTNGATRIGIADTAVVRPGGPPDLTDSDSGPEPGSG